MKRIAVLFLCMFLLMSMPAFAAPETIDLETMSLSELQTLVERANAKIGELTPKPAPDPYKTYEKGSKGEGVKAIQERLIELKYLTGKADGGYGDKTAAGVSAFQKVLGLTPTGIADSDTQTRLFGSNAPVNPEPPFDPSAYEKLNYKAVARDPEAYEGALISFSGTVIQVVEGDTETKYRISTKGSYDDIVLVGYERPAGASRILEDDKVNVYGICVGVYSYESTGGSIITIPACFAERIELK